MAVARRDQFLDECNSIDSQFQLGFVDGGVELLNRIKTHDAGAAPADVWLYQQRKSDL